MLNHIAIIRWIKGILPFQLRIVIIKAIVMMQDVFYVKMHLKKKDFGKEKKIFVLLSTDYSNLGDHGMTYAHINLLKNRYPDYKIIEILVNDTLKSLYSIIHSCMPEDIITLKGGGNVGVEYYREELIRRKIIQYVRDNKIIMFPQTVSFPDTDFGKKEFQKTVDVFNGNQNFYAFYRDRVSYDLMSQYCKNSYLTPDIVFSLGRIDMGASNRNGAMICMRSDVEGIYGETAKKMVYEVLAKHYGTVDRTDTIRNYKIETIDREAELFEIWKEIGEAELIVTDRLHGMIFAVLLGTPCIVLNTYNHKLRGQYEWIRSLNYVRCIDLDEANLDRAIEELKNVKVSPIRPDAFQDLYGQIFDIIEGKNLDECGQR